MAHISATGTVEPEKGDYRIQDALTVIIHRLSRITASRSGVSNVIKNKSTFKFVFQFKKHLCEQLKWDGCEIGLKDVREILQYFFSVKLSDFKRGERGRHCP